MSIRVQQQGNVFSLKLLLGVRIADLIEGEFVRQ